MNLMIQQGWQCSCCGKVYSPTTTMCFYCPPKVTVESNTASPQRQPLHDMAIFDLADTHLYEGGKNYGVLAFARAIEAAHGIKEKTNA